jgi:hypothetical protein
MKKIEVRVIMSSMVISKEFNKEKEAKKFIYEEVKKYNNITRIEIQNYIYNDCGLLTKSNIKYFYEW